MARGALSKPPATWQHGAMEPTAAGPTAAPAPAAPRAPGARAAAHAPPAAKLDARGHAAHDALQGAFAALARALANHSATALDDGVAARCSALWRERLLWGEGAPLGARLLPGLLHAGEEAVVLRGIGVHLVCPHHLTVALGRAALAYLPRGRIAGLGALAEVVEASCARLVLQEDAAHDAARAVVDALGARACVVRIEARHPCHALTRPRSHAARVRCDGSAGEAASIGALRLALADGRRP